MRTVYAILSCGAGVLFCLVTTGTAQGQTHRPGVYRMEINNGGSQTVRYFGQGISPGESAALRDLERSENELTFVRNLQDLKRQYVSDERQIEAARSLAKQELYDRYMAAGGYGIYGTFPGLDSGLLAAYNLGGNYGLGAYYGLGGYYGLAGGYTPGLYAGLGLGGAYSGLLGTQALGTAVAAGFGNNDPIRQSVAGVIGQQATPQYAAQVDRNVDRAVAQAGSSPAMRVALGIPDAGSRPGAYIRPVAAATESQEPVVVTLKDGTVLQGDKLQETKDWIIVTNAKGRKMRVRPSEVTRIEEAKPAVGGAVGD